MYLGCLFNNLKFEIGLSHPLKTKKTLKLGLKVLKSETHYSIFPGASANGLGGLTTNISQGHNSVFDFFFPVSLLERKDCGFKSRMTIFIAWIREKLWSGFPAHEWVIQRPLLCGRGGISSDADSVASVTQAFIHVPAPRELVWLCALCWGLALTNKIDKSLAIQPRGKGDITFRLFW